MREIFILNGLDLFFMKKRLNIVRKYGLLFELWNFFFYCENRILFNWFFIRILILFSVLLIYIGFVVLFYVLFFIEDLKFVGWMVGCEVVGYMGRIFEGWL